MFKEQITFCGRLSILLLLFLLSVQFAIFSRGPFHAISVDEAHYVKKADQLLNTGTIPRAKGSGDWRPIGYSLFLACINGITGNWVTSRIVCALIQFTLLSFVLIVFQTIACWNLKQSRALFITAILLGLQRWVFEDSRNMIPDSLTASLTTLGLLGLCAASSLKNQLQIPAFIVSGVILCSTIFLRPEMIVMTPLFILAVVVFEKHRRSIVLRKMVIGLFILFMFLAFQILYWEKSTGKWEIYGNYSVRKLGAHNWTQSWFSTEQMAYAGFLHDNNIFSKTLNDFPEHAFADEWERNTIGEALARARQKQIYDQSVDALFQKVAEKRVRDNYFINSVLTRVWRTGMMWFYFESDNPVSKRVNQPVLRSAIPLGFYLLKMIIFALAVCSAIFTIRSIRNGTFDWYHRLTGLMLLCITIRTLLMGVVLGWMIHRYALAAWPAMMWCAVSAIVTIARNQQEMPAKRSPSALEQERKPEINYSPS